MKKASFIAAAMVVAIGFTSCGNEEQQQQTESSEITTDIINNPNTATADSIDPETVAIITFDDVLHEFGQITQGEKVRHAFKFTNTGKSDLIITSATGSCGCTVPQWPKEPIAPGESNIIDVVFDSNGKQGMKHNTVTLVANTLPNKTVIAMKGEVLVPTNN